MRSLYLRRASTVILTTGCNQHRHDMLPLPPRHLTVAYVSGQNTASREYRPSERVAMTPMMAGLGPRWASTHELLHFGGFYSWTTSPPWRLRVRQPAASQAKLQASKACKAFNCSTPSTLFSSHHVDLQIIVKEMMLDSLRIYSLTLTLANSGNAFAQ